MSAAEVAEINAHTDEKANEVIAFLSKVINSDDPEDLGLTRMVASMHHGDYGEKPGAAGGDLGWLDRHLKAQLKPIFDHLGIAPS